jgi:putative hydrolase of the HAD superfamily
MPGPHFEAFAMGGGVAPASDPAAWSTAMHAGNTVLADEPVVPTVDDEVVLFTRYFTVLAQSLGLPSDQGSMRALAGETVFGTGHEATYEGVEEVLRKLVAAGTRLFLLANGWPSLTRRYEELGLRELFEFFVTSTQLGIKKPNPRVFRLVSEMTNVPAARLLIVDDLAANVLTGASLGMPGVLVGGGTRPTTPGVEWIEGVSDLPQWLGRGR